MSWYYAQSDKQTGPISDAEFEALVQNGIITNATLVWREGMPNWQPYQQIRGGTPAAGLGSGPTSPAAGASGGPASAAVPGANEVVCAECRQVFSRDNAINYGTVWVCSACKPLFVQKLKEGAATPFQTGDMRYAGFWIRFVAKFIDMLVLGVVTTVPTLVIMFGAGFGNMNQTNTTGAQILLQIVLQIFSLTLTVGYNTWFVGKYGATPGKMAVSLKVVAPDGSPISYMRAFGRAWGDVLTSLTCTIGYIIAAFDSEKRALHDHICTTRVVYK